MALVPPDLLSPQFVQQVRRIAHRPIGNAIAGVVPPRIFCHRTGLYQRPQVVQQQTLFRMQHVGELLQRQFRSPQRFHDIDPHRIGEYMVNILVCIVRFSFCRCDWFHHRTKNFTD